MRSIVILIAMFGLLGDARAEKKVDWSQYLESPSERAKQQRRATPTAAAKPAKAAKKAKPTRAKATKQRPVAQAKAKRKPARRR